MRVRFGYVAMALGIPEGSPNKTTTVANLMKIPDPADRISRLRRLTRENLDIQLRVLRYNAAHDIRVFRFTSRLVPLATHPVAAAWDWPGEFAAELAAIGDYAKIHAMRVSAHPDHFTLLNSPSAEVLAASRADLAYHAALFGAMGLGADARLVVHIGGLYKAKAQALDRFAANYRELSPDIAARLVVENDDRTYTAADVLGLCRRLGLPMVLDIHHHAVNSGGDSLGDLLPAIFATWGDALPKIHLSSPKSPANPRAHADHIDPGDFLPFLDLARELGHDFDVMIEAKEKDRSLFRLMEQAAGWPGVRTAGHAAIEC